MVVRVAYAVTFEEYFLDFANHGIMKRKHITLEILESTQTVALEAVTKKRKDRRIWSIDHFTVHIATFGITLS